MNELQVGLAVAGLALLGAVLVFNRIREQRHKRLVAQLVPAQEGQDDATATGPSGVSSAALRTEPGLETPGAVPWEATSGAHTMRLGEAADPALEFAVTLRAPRGLGAGDFWQTLVKSGVMTRHVRWVGYPASDLSGPCYAIEEPGTLSFQVIQGLLQLASRSGPVNEARLTLFMDEMRSLAKQLQAAFQAGDPQQGLTNALALEQFCSQVDVIIGINVVLPEGKGVTMERLYDLAATEGLRLQEDGAYHWRDAQGNDRFTLTHREGKPLLVHEADGALVSAVTFLLDVPRVAEALPALREMFAMAERLARTLNARVVDDNDAPLGLRQLAAIEKQLTGILARMDNQGVAPGSPLATRLFSH